MADISRDSFLETQNSLINIRGITPIVQPEPKHYVSIQLQQGVPFIDADFNEQERIRRVELETILASAIGSGVPAGNDGFRITEALVNSDFVISAGYMFCDGWLVIGESEINFSSQPHRNADGVDPVLPLLVDNAVVEGVDLVYLDSWETEINVNQDENLVDVSIGIETSVRLERVWVVRIVNIAFDADPFNPATIPTQIDGHRYYPLAMIDRQVGGVISAGMIHDIRRTHLTLEALTNAPLLIDDPDRGQRLNSERLSQMFRDTLDVLWDIYTRQPETFMVLTGGGSSQEPETSIAMTAFQDIRASAIALEEQALGEQLHAVAALQAMNRFYNVEIVLLEILEQFITDVISSVAMDDFVEVYARHLNGSSPADDQSVVFALDIDDLLGAVMAQERFNIEIALSNDLLPEGTVSASLISINPVGNVEDNTMVAQYQLTIRIDSNLMSAQGIEPIRAIASAGTGWNISFQGTTESDVREILVDVDNLTTQNIVMLVSVDPGAANTNLVLTVRPERRQQLAFNHPPVALALGQEIIAGGAVIATMTYEGPALLPGNVAQVPRGVMFGGVTLPFEVTNLSGIDEEYQLTALAQGVDTGWDAPNQPILPLMNPGENRLVDITFQTNDEPGAVTLVTFQMQLVRVTGSVNEPQTNTTTEITFELQP